MKLYIKKENLKATSNGAKWIIYVLMYYMLSYSLVYTFNMPRILLYCGDILNIIVFLFSLRFRKIVNMKNNTIKFMILFSILGIISSVINTTNLGLLVWGIRNNLRYFIFFYSCIIFLKIQDIAIVMYINKILFWISIPLCTFERFFISYSSDTIIGDMIGGVFWNFSGANIPFNIILCLYLLDVACNYFKGKIKNFHFIIVSVFSLYMAALAELKVFLVEFIIIMFFSAIFSGVSFKSIIKIIFGIILFVFSITYFIEFNKRGDNYASNYTIQGFIEYASRDTGYNGDGDLNRLTGIYTVSKKIFKDNYLAKLIGIGLGNAEYTNFFVSSFYKQYSKLNYQWFHDIWMYIEMGILGIVIFLMILFSSYIKAKKVLNNSFMGNYVRISILLMIILFVYNNSLRSETTGFVLYLILSIPYIALKEEKLNILKNNGGRKYDS